MIPLLLSCPWPCRDSYEVIGVARRAYTRNRASPPRWPVETAPSYLEQMFRNTSFLYLIKGIQNVQADQQRARSLVAIISILEFGMFYVEANDVLSPDGFLSHSKPGRSTNVYVLT